MVKAMKVTIRGVDKKLWEQARIDAIKENKTMGELVNEGLKLRQQTGVGQNVKEPKK